jgi:hypothetical protein
MQAAVAASLWHSLKQVVAVWAVISPWACQSLQCTAQTMHSTQVQTMHSTQVHVLRRQREGPWFAKAGLLESHPGNNLLSLSGSKPMDLKADRSPDDVARSLLHMLERL